MREIRRKDRAMNDEAEMLQLLLEGEYGVLSTVGVDGLPYGVPLSYVLNGNAIYFHCAYEGRKIENIAHQPQVSFAVMGMAEAVYTQYFTTYYSSVLVFGTMTLVEEEAEKVQALMMLAEKYLPEYMDRAPGDIAGSLAKTAVYRLDIDSMSGKQKKKP
ncbi:pyridoxamine 5'-phosphate oxidase family protein [Eubacteriales bacterium OttesenSCG-928-N14]|nr:pyridoxamine 5'-phosphate oxidase family protein [Eubacteriales bacterium OttesenSCG-928-N14]